MNYLKLVNKSNPLEKCDVPLYLKEINHEYNIGKNNLLDKKVKFWFELMAKNAKKDNIILKNISAYRSYEYQEKLYESYKENNLENLDMSSAKAGFSEHQTGFALDINMDNINFYETDEYKWLSKNAYKYGFILRYPKDKENITGYKFEPWHYRFVGRKHSKIIYENNLTLEEYIEKKQK